MKHLFNFDTLTEYNNVKDTLEKPYVVTIDENNSLRYNTDVVRVPEGSVNKSNNVKYYGWHNMDTSFLRRATLVNFYESSSDTNYIDNVHVLHQLGGPESSHVTIYAISIDYDLITWYNGEFISAKDAILKETNQTIEQFEQSNGWIEITEEQFYHFYHE